MLLRQKLPIPSHTNSSVYWDRLYGCAQADAVIRSIENNFALLIVENISEALRWESELRFFADSRLPIHLFQDWETLPYDIFSPHQSITATRLSILSQIQKHPYGIIIIAADTLMQRLPPVDFVLSRSFSLTTGEEFDLGKFRRYLDASGYQAVSQVVGHGEYTVRGSIFDIFAPGSTEAIRIDLLDNTIDSLRWFDPETQISTNTVDSIAILPAREFPTDEESIKRFRRRFRELIDSAPEESLIYRDASIGNSPAGIEYYFPLFFKNTASFFDYLPDSATLFMSDSIVDCYIKHWRNIQQRYTQTRSNVEYPPLDPDFLFLNPNELQKLKTKFPQVVISSFKNTQEQAYHGNTHLLPALFLQKGVENPAANLKKLLKQVHGRALIVAETAGYREQIIETLTKQNIYLKVINDWQSFLQVQSGPCICIGELHTGALFEKENFAVISDHQILDRNIKRKHRRHKRTNSALLFENLTELGIDCPIVHEKYGVGRYRGLETLNFGGSPAEFLVLEYADKEKLYVPISSLNLITRYTGGSPDTAPLHALSGKQWHKTKRKAAQKAFDTAVELLDAQTRRTKAQGFQHKINTQDYLKFTEEFPFEETPDQIKVIAEILDDMCSSIPMDRIVCGDVGFGKTEIAMRAAFTAAQNNRQTVVLVPTTLLANQHFQNFRARFADWAIQVEILSRFLSPSEQKKVREKIKNGVADIVIGTHKLLYRNVEFKRPGLIIIDEEHRFGVRHKELLKSRYVNCDILTLSATPIPRTLNMSLSGLRDLSIIATPPLGRLAIKTFVHEWNNELIKESCQRELKRGGQVYFLHNNISTMDGIVKKLHRLLPRSKILSAHGKMPERELESVMLDFYRRRINILVCTTIIESGLDIPTANSIIINEADRLGLSQLHQLRGRVGRSHHRAYAYLLLSNSRVYLPHDAVKRLEAIESLEELGAGFAIASQDLEIRGAGELLGDGQSGHIREVGFTLYNEMLKHAINALQSGTMPNMDRPLNTITEVNLGEPAIIPQDYVPDVNIRLILYRRIAAAKDINQLDELQREIVDRFGKLPSYLKNLFTNASLRLDCFSVGIQKIAAGCENIRLEFDQNPNINFTHLMNIIQESPETYRLDRNGRLSIRQKLPEMKDRLDAVQNLLNEITYIKAA